MQSAVKELEVELRKLKNTSYDSIDRLMRVIMKKYNITAKDLHNSFVHIHHKTPDIWIKTMKEETKSGDEGLHDWFNKSKSSDGKKGWVQLGGKYAGKPCARQQGQTSTPKCGSSKMSANLSPEEKEAARLRKNRLDPNQPEKTGASKPTNVRTEEMNLQEVKDKPTKGSGKKDACYNKVKSRYDVWPSAYASGALVKCRKVGADNWGTKSEAANPAQQAAIAIDMKKKGIKPKNMKEESEMIRYCPLCRKKETRSECSYGEKTWDEVSIKDHEYSMARSELDTLMKAAQRIKKKVAKGEGNLEAWVQAKITKAADYIDTAADYIDSGEMNEAKSFGFEIKKSSGAGALTPDAAKQLGPKAVELQKKKASAVSLPKLKEHKGIVAEIIKDLQEKGPCWKGYTQVGMKKKNGKKVPNCVASEEVELDEAVRIPAATGNILSIILSWRGKTYMTKMFFPQVGMPSRKEITFELQKVYPDCRIVSYSIADIKPGEPLIQVSNSKSKNYLLNIGTIGEEMEELDEDTPAWQRKEGKNPEGGLNKKGIASYRKEHPGSHLSLAVTKKPSELKPGSKSANRRKSFCSRMKGMKAKLTSAKTANDPNSRINKSLRKWNC